jgi:hypothetical protein
MIINGKKYTKERVNLSHEKTYLQIIQNTNEIPTKDVKNDERRRA